MICITTGIDAPNSWSTNLRIVALVGDATTEVTESKRPIKKGIYIVGLVGFEESEGDLY